MKKIIIIFVGLCFLSCTQEKEIEKLNVLVLGNSITQNAPSENIGWFGNWGMAASAPEKDFCSLLRNNENIKSLTAINIANWERDFSTDMNFLLKATTNPYDLVIIRLCENVSTTIGYENALTYLTKKFNCKIIISSTVWYAPEKDLIASKVALDNDYIFCDLKDIQKDNSNYAYVQFQNEGVSAHPSDIGMKFIADKIINSIETKITKHFVF